MNLQFDDIPRGRRIKILNVTDEFTREVPRRRGRSPSHRQGHCRWLEQIVAERGVPTHIRCDNGPEFIAKALQRWCRRRSSRTHIESGAPWENPVVESYNGHIRKELLALELLDSVLEAQGADR